MAGFTNYAYRQIVRHFGGVGLLATEMVSARSFAWMDRSRRAFPDRLWGVADEPRPLAVQIWDNDPETLARVGRSLAEEFHVSVVDLNFGCPVKQVTQDAQSGSYLLRDPRRMAAIISRVVDACHPVPVTAKIRLGCSRSQVNATEVAQVVEEAGAAALTVHGRTAQDFFRGQADWERIAEVKPYLKKIPLIGNGDLQSADDVVAAFRDHRSRRSHDCPGQSRTSLAVSSGRRRDSRRDGTPRSILGGTAGLSDVAFPFDSGTIRGRKGYVLDAKIRLYVRSRMSRCSRISPSRVPHRHTG